jgi:RND superfamily putative drug exporter
MAELLYKLGRFSVKRAWLVITTWILLLVVTVTAMIVSGGKLSSAMSIDGIPAQKVIDELKKSFPAASHGNASIIFHTPNGTFTAKQKREIGVTLAGVKKLQDVASVVNPFTTQATKDHQVHNLKVGQRKISTGKDQIAAAKKALAAGQIKLDAAKKLVSENLVMARTGLAAAVSGKAQA